MTDVQDSTEELYSKYSKWQLIGISILFVSTVSLVSLFVLTAIPGLDTLTGLSELSSAYTNLFFSLNGFISVFGFTVYLVASLFRSHSSE